MATVDTREGDDSFRAEVYMKIWQWDRKSGFWILNTRIDRPHGPQRVSGVAFRPGMRSQDDLLLATVGEDGNIKTWRIRSVKTKADGIEGASGAFARWPHRSDTRLQSSGSLAQHSVSAPKSRPMCRGPQMAPYSPCQWDLMLPSMSQTRMLSVRS